MVTGANGGLGSATVAKILRRPDLAAYTGIYAVRKAATATQLKEKLQSAPKHHTYQLIDMDLSSIASVKTAATDINAKVADGTLPPIRTLILNAAYQDSLEMVKGKLVVHARIDSNVDRPKLMMAMRRHGRSTPCPTSY